MLGLGWTFSDGGGRLCTYIARIKGLGDDWVGGVWDGMGWDGILARGGKGIYNRGGRERKNYLSEC